MSAPIRIAIDAMSGDLGPRVAISAAQKFTATFPDVEIILVGDKQQLLSRNFSLTQSANKSAANQSLSNSLEKNNQLEKKLAAQSIKVFHASDVVAMTEDPLTALRHKKESSMWKALELVAQGEADACVSAGNTGALLAMSRHLVKTCEGVERPAICKAMPSEKNSTYVLDLGANINCTSQQLYQFAVMGHVLASQKKSSPSLALLNIGVEEIKGTEVIKQAQQLIQQNAQLNYQGYVEANQLFSGDNQVIVCDGFHGNLALKTCEGTARFIARKIQAMFKHNWITRFLSMLMWPLIKQLRLDLDPAMHNGASFLGLQKVVVKSHGGANKKAFMQSLVVAREQVQQKIPQLIQKEFSSSAQAF